jgi:hypothetical protein
MTKFTSSQGKGGANNPAHPVLIHAMAGTIFVGGEPVPYAEAEILRDVASEEFMAAMRSYDVPGMAMASHKEHSLRNAIWNAARYRRAAGYSDPCEADR